VGHPREIPTEKLTTRSSGMDACKRVWMVARGGIELRP